MEGQAIDEQRFSSVPSIPTAIYQTTKGDSVMMDIEEDPEPSPSEHRANETQTDETSYQTTKGDSVTIGIVEDQEPGPREHRANETQTDERHYPNIIEPLYRAALEGDWQRANDLYKKYPHVATWELPPEMDALQVQVTIWELPLTKHEMNALQVAVAAEQTAFVKELLTCMNEKELEFQNVNRDTGLTLTAMSGNVKIAKKMVEKNRGLPMIRNNQEFVPLLLAAMHRQRDMVSYLYYVTMFEELTNDERIKLLIHVIFYDLYDIALEILKEDSSLTIAEDENGRTVLEQLAWKPSAIGSRSQMSFWKICIGYGFKGFYHKSLMRTLAHQLVEHIWKEVPKLPSETCKYCSTIFTAAKLGNVEFVTILLRSEPNLIWLRDENDRNIFQISVLYRQENIFKLIHEIGIFKNMIAANCDKDKNNMLHLVGKMDHVNPLSGAALHMRRELIWYKEIEKIMPLSYLNAKNRKGKTPKDLFTKTHQKLQTEGEKWMRDTAKHFMLVATLVATVVFAAAFTIPGGNDQSNGIPIFVELNWFTVFFISDSIAFLSSSTSILIFLSILTSHFKEQDFVDSLPKRLIFGLTTLFISIAGMVVALGAPCFLVYQRKMIRLPIVIISLAGVPISTFVLLHYKLFVDIIISSNYFFRFGFQSRKTSFFLSIPSIN